MKECINGYITEAYSDTPKMFARCKCLYHSSERMSQYSESFEISHTLSKNITINSIKKSRINNIYIYWCYKQSEYKMAIQQTSWAVRV